jgi:hypothetical protein
MLLTSFLIHRSLVRYSSHYSTFKHHWSVLLKYNTKFQARTKEYVILQCYVVEIVDIVSRDEILKNSWRLLTRLDHVKNEHTTK